MNRDDLPRLSKEEVIDLVLKFQRRDKTSRTLSKRLWCKRLKRGIFAPNLSLEEANPGAEHG
jgi:hypothetical protein